MRMTTNKLGEVASGPGGGGGAFAGKDGGFRSPPLGRSPPKSTSVSLQAAMAARAPGAGGGVASRAASSASASTTTAAGAHGIKGTPFAPTPARQAALAARAAALGDGAPAAAETPVSVVALGDPIFDIIAFEPENLLEKLGYECGGCVSVENYSEIEDLVKLVDLKSRVPGGSAANVVKGVAGLARNNPHLQCSFVGKVGTDAAGEEYARRLTNAGVRPLLAHSAASTPTAEAVSIVSANGQGGAEPALEYKALTRGRLWGGTGCLDAQRTMRPYLGAAKELTVADLPMDAIRSCSLLHLEGYALFRPEVSRAAMEAARAAGATVSLDLASFEIVRGMRAQVLEFLSMVDLVFCNEDEAAALVQEEHHIGSPEGVPEEVIMRAVSLLSKSCAVVTVSRGRQGCMTYGGGDRLIHVPACCVTAVDTTGAGDLFTSGFLSAYLEGLSLDQCGRRGCFMGSQVVQQLGAELPPACWEDVHITLPYLAGSAPDAAPEAPSPNWQ